MTIAVTLVGHTYQEPKSEMQGTVAHTPTVFFCISSFSLVDPARRRLIESEADTSNDPGSVSGLGDRLRELTTTVLGMYSAELANIMKFTIFLYFFFQLKPENRIF